jgi:hypothetical protein
MSYARLVRKGIDREIKLWLRFGRLAVGEAGLFGDSAEGWDWQGKSRVELGFASAGGDRGVALRSEPETVDRMEQVVGAEVGVVV